MKYLFSNMFLRGLGTGAALGLGAATQTLAADPEEFVTTVTSDWMQLDADFIKEKNYGGPDAFFFIATEKDNVAIDDLSIQLVTDKTNRLLDWTLNWTFDQAAKKKLAVRKDYGFLNKAARDKLPKVPDAIVLIDSEYPDFLTFKDGKAVFAGSATWRHQPKMVYKFPGLVNHSFTAEMTITILATDPADGQSTDNERFRLDDLGFGLSVPKEKGMFLYSPQPILCRASVRENRTLAEQGKTADNFFSYELGVSASGPPGEYEAASRGGIFSLDPFATPISSPTDFPKLRLRMEWDAEKASLRCSVHNDWDRKPVVKDVTVEAGDYTCPAGKTLATREDARASNSLICGSLTDGQTVRLAAGGVMTKASGACSVVSWQTAPAAHTMCKAPAPRLDGITLKFNPNDRNYNSGTSYDFFLHGANLLPGAKAYLMAKIPGIGSGQGQGVVVDLKPVASFDNSKNLNVKNPGTLGYPIFTYDTLALRPDYFCPNGTLECIYRGVVRVINPDGQTSDPVAFTVPGVNSNYNYKPDPATLDSDGDGITDWHEINGVDTNYDGVLEIDFKAMGANPFRKDLFIEVDWMKDYAPSETIWAAAIETFAKAPVLNPDGSMGITLHIDYGQDGFGGKDASGKPIKGKGGSEVGGGTHVHFGDSNDGNKVSFYTIKDKHFDKARLKYFRYAIFAHANGDAEGSSGRAEGIWGNDFFVSLGGMGALAKVPVVQLGTFLHELGHTLNLGHGGFDQFNNNKPNYNSIMQYGRTSYCSAGAVHRQANGAVSAFWANKSEVKSVQDRVGQIWGIDTDCDPTTFSRVYTFSQGMRAPLDENNLMEPAGVCDAKPRDWNWDCDATDTEVAYDVNPHQVTELPEPHKGVFGARIIGSGKIVLEDSADWARIELDFTHKDSNWGSN
ncbi:MAG: hypothetical protein AAF393_05470 [Pseudomonadota bacterium]